MVWQLFLNTLSAWAFYATLAMGFGFTLRSTKFFNFSFGGSFLMGGYMTYLFYRSLELPLFVSMGLSLFVSGLYLLFCYKLVFGVLMRRKAKGLVCLIASFGLLALTSAVIGMIFGNQINFGARQLSDIFSTNVLGASLNLVQLSAIVSISFIIAFLAFLRAKTRFGIAMRAVEDDVEVAELAGISKEKTFMKIFFLSGVLGGLAGMAEAFDLGVIPASGLSIMLPTVVAAVVGGMWSFWGGVLGAFVLAVSQQLTTVFVGGEWIQAVPFVILIVILFIRPEGILKK